MPAALNGAGGKFHGAGCRVWAAHLYLHAPTALGLNPKAKPLATISTEGCSDTGRVYQPGLAVYISLGITKLAREHGPRTINSTSERRSCNVAH